MVFEKKKLNLETLSEYLVSVRDSSGLALEEVSKKTGIKLKFLEDLEEGELVKLPPDVYVVGFLRQLAALYNIEAPVLIEQYKKERNIQQQVFKPAVNDGSWKDRVLKKLVITPKLVSLAVGLLFVAVSLGYIIWQVFSIDRAPSLDIFEPQDRQVVQGSSVSIRGKTDAGMSIAVNSQDLFVDNQGNFKAQLGISPGSNNLVVTARNKFDKTTTKTISIVGEGQASQSSSSPVQLRLEFSGSATVQVVVDEGQVQEFTFNEGDAKQFSGQKQILLSTTDAGVTKTVLNGQSLGAMGRPGEQLKNVSFFPESGIINTVDN